MTAPAAWSAVLEVVCDPPERAARLYRTLAPEAAREVPRASAQLERSGEALLRLTVSARDTGALRAALNTYLGWVELVGATEAVVDRRR